MIRAKAFAANAEIIDLKVNRSEVQVQVQPEPLIHRAGGSRKKIELYKGFESRWLKTLSLGHVTTYKQR